MKCESPVGLWKGCGPGSWFRILTTRTESKGPETAEITYTLLAAEPEGARIRVSDSGGHEHDFVQGPVHPMGPIDIQGPLFHLLDEEPLAPETLEIAGARHECAVRRRRVRKSPQCGNDRSTGTLMVDTFWTSKRLGLVKRSSHHIQDYQGEHPRELNPVLTVTVVGIDEEVELAGKAYSTLAVRSEYWNHDLRFRNERTQWFCPDLPLGWIRITGSQSPFPEEGRPTWRNVSRVVAFEIR